MRYMQTPDNPGYDKVARFNQGSCNHRERRSDEPDNNKANLHW